MRIAALAGSEFEKHIAHIDSEIANTYLKQMEALVRGTPIKPCWATLQ